MAKKTEDTNIEKLNQEIQDWKNKYLRALADYANAEKRSIGVLEAKLRFQKANFLKGFLEVFDHLERANKHLKDEGLNIVVKEFNDLFQKSDVREIKIQPGEDFSSLKSECVEVVPVDEKNDGKIIEVLQKGYELGDIVIRPVKVKVGKKQILEKEAEKLNS